MDPNEINKVGGITSMSWYMMPLNEDWPDVPKNHKLIKSELPGLLQLLVE